MTRTRNQKGFTIVELLIVIVVIGILAALVITTFTGIQKKARDTERQTDIKALHGQLEAYFAQNGKYPTLANMNDRASGGFLATNMKGLDKEATKDPKSTASGDAQYNLAGAAAANVYSYAVTPTDCNNTTTECTGYKLTATLEGGGTFEKDALN
jgi:general secretion pathway protein G